MIPLVILCSLYFLIAGILFGVGLEMFYMPNYLIRLGYFFMCLGWPVFIPLGWISERLGNG